MSEKKSITQSRLYPVIFMVILSAVLTLALALFYQLTIPRVVTHKNVKFQTELLSLFETMAPELAADKLEKITPEAIDKLYQKYITESTMGDDLNIKYYQFEIDNKKTGLVFPVISKGLWSSIEMLAAIEPDFSRYIGIKIIAQGETPGLGARIMEAWFQEQFSGKKFVTDMGFIELKLVEENATAKDDQIKKITGATASSRAVLIGIQKEMQKYFKLYFEQKDKGDI